MVEFLLVVSAIACLLLGGLVLFQDKSRFSNQLFSGICVCFAVWSVSILVFLGADSVTVGYVAAKVFYLVAAIFPCLLLLFALLFPNKERVTVATQALIGVVGAVMSLFIIFSPYFVIDMIILSSQGNYIIVDKSSYILYSIYFILLFSIAILVAMRKFISNRGDRRMQSGLYAFGILINSIPGFITNLLLPYFAIYDYIWVGPAASVFFLGLTTYGIVRHSLFDIRLAAVRSTAYVFALITLSAIYYLLAYLVSVSLFQGEVNSSFSVSPINILLALLLAFVFQPIKQFFDKVTNNIFYRDGYNSDEFFARLSGVLTSTTDLRTLLERAAYEVSKTLKADQAFFFVYHMGDHHISAGTSPHNHLPVQDARELDKYVEMHGDNAIVTDLLTDNHVIQRLLQSHKIAVLLPLNRRDNQIIGYLALGEQRASGYTNKDVKVLATISDELVIAIQNSLSVQEVRDINTHLQQRIEAATHELRSSNAQLRHLDTTKDEFLSMASHQLRTPLTSVKGYISMVLEGDAGKITDMQKHLLGEAFTSSERMVHLIHDFLNVSRLQTGKFMLEQHPYDLVGLVKQEVDSLRHTAESRQLKLKFECKTKELVLNIDENKIRQVVMNFIDNSLFYSHEDTTITIELIKENDMVEVRVNDTGIGVPKSEQAQLFSKFYRASNARKQRPDGTGVGLYLAKKVVTAHGGDVLFESKEGEGSTFGFSMPLKKLRVIESTDNAD